MSDKEEKPNKLPLPEGPEGKSPYGTALILVIAIAIYLIFTVGGNPLAAQEKVDTLAVNEFVTAVNDDRVEEVTYKTSDGSATGKYWPDGSGKDDDSKLVRFKTFYIGHDSLDELMAAHPDTKFTVDTSNDDLLETILVSVVPTVLLVGVFVFYMRRIGEQNGRSMSFGKTKARTTEE